MLIRLIYASTVGDNVNLDELKRILAQSQVNNQRRDLTGVLAFNSKILLQALEGGRDVVNALYAKLLADPRHHKVMLLKYQEISSRQWGGWSMGFAAPHAENRAVFLKHSAHSVFNPYAMSGDAVEAMLADMVGKTLSLTVSDSAMPGAPAMRPIVTDSKTETPTPRPAAETGLINRLLSR